MGRTSRPRPYNTVVKRNMYVMRQSDCGAGLCLPGAQSLHTDPETPCAKRQKSNASDGDGSDGEGGSMEAVSGVTAPGGKRCKVGHCHEVIRCTV